MTLDNYQNNVKNLQGNLLSYALILTSDRDRAYQLLGDTNSAILDRRDEIADNYDVKQLAMRVMKIIFKNRYTRRVPVRHSKVYKIEVEEEAPGYSGIAIEESRLTQVINGLEGESRTIFSLYLTGHTVGEISLRIRRIPSEVETSVARTLRAVRAML